jgi:hypothetical protein
MDLKKIIAVSILGKMNEPLFFYSEEDYEESLHLQMVLHSSLDSIDEKRRKGNLGAVGADMYLGHLLAFDDYKIFGFVSNTQTKALIVCDIGSSESGVRESIQLLYNAYIIAIQSPFQETSMPVTSRKFIFNVQQIIQKYNSSAVLRR